MAWLNRKKRKKKKAIIVYINVLASVVTHVIMRRLQFHSKHCSTEKSMQKAFA